MSVPLKIVIESEQSPQFQAAIDQIEGRVSRLNTAENRTRMQALAIMRGQTVAANAIATAQARVSKEVAQVTQQMSRQAGFMASLRSAFGGGLAARGGEFGRLAGAGFTGGALGGFVGAGLAMAVTGFISAIKQMTIGAIQTADALSDTADMLGMRRTDVLALQEASMRAGVPSRIAIRGASNLARLRAAALSGDQEAMALFHNYGVTPELLGGGASAMDIAMQIRESLGRQGATSRDELALQKIFGEMPRRFLHILNNMVQDSGELESKIQNLDRISVQYERFKFGASRLLTWVFGSLVDVYDAFKDGSVLLGGRLKGVAMAQEALRRAEQAASIGPAIGAERTAGFWEPTRKSTQPEKRERSWIWRSFDLESGGMSRLGLYGTRGQEVLARSALNVQRSMLDTLRAIDRTLSSSPMLKETLTP